MSGGPGGGVPECVGQTYSGFIVPRAGATFDTGQTLNITWYGGVALEATGRTAIFDIGLAHNNNSNNTSGSRWEKTVFSSKAYVFESDRTDRDGVWTNFDACGNTAFYQLWTISSDLDFSSNDFVLIAKNVTTDTENRMYTSNVFVIHDDEGSTSSSSSITATTTTSYLSSPSTTTSSNHNRHSGLLSTGAKAGIGVGSGVAVIVLVLLGFWVYYKRRRAGTNSGSNSRGGIAGAADLGGYQKAELDGHEGMKAAAREADGVQIFEADAGDHDAIAMNTREKTPPPLPLAPQDPVELPAERFERHV